MQNSKKRYETITTRLQQAAPQISPETARSLLAAPYPTGLYAHYYEEYFGTLHTMLFDATALTVEVCFGSPQVNPWHPFNLRHPGASDAYTVMLPLERTTPEFWERIAL
jgi:hypothetical protein